MAEPALYARMELRLREFEKQLDRAVRSADRGIGRIEGRAKVASSRIDASLAAAFRTGTAALAGFGAGALAALGPIELFQKAMRTIEEAGHIVDTADKIGLTTTALQELSFGFSQAGVAVADFEANMAQFGKRIGEAATRGGQLAGIFKANGIALRDANGNIKSAEELLRSYANLVRNAATEQEKLVLVTEAFGRGGDDMVIALNEGADGIDRMKKAAADAGGVIDERLLRRAEEMGDRWEAAWRRFEVNSASAILSALEGLDHVRALFRDFEKRRDAAAAGALIGSLAGTRPPEKGRRLTGPDFRIDQAFSGKVTAADDELLKLLKERYGRGPQTIIPSGDKGTSRNASAAAALREAQAVVELIEGLELERSLIGATEAERAKANLLRQAGSAATEEQRATIEALVDAIYRERDATDAAAEATRELREIGRETLGGLINDMIEGKSAADALSGALRNIGNRLLDSGLDALFSGGKSGGSGLLSILFGGGGFKPNTTGGRFFMGLPGFANGTSYAPGGMALVGERGPEVVNLPRGSQVIPNARLPNIREARSGEVIVTINAPIDARGADEAGLARVAAQVAQLKAELPSRVVETVREARKARQL